MAADPTSHKVRHRTFDRLRQKLWAVPAHLRIRLLARGTVKPRRPHRSASIR
jgi:hypothetical protein